MNLRHQTQSLDRDFNRTKRKRNSHQNIEKINNNAERVACRFNKQIEDAYALYPIQQFSELSKESLVDIVNDLEKTISLDGEDFINVKIAVKENLGYYLLSQYIDFVIEVKTLLHGIDSLLSKHIRHGLIPFCLSLADYCTPNIHFVINYEKIIQKNSPEIIKEMEDIARLMVEFRRYTTNSRSILLQCSELIDAVGKIRACINKLYYLITEWVDEERCYSQNLFEERKRVKSEMFKLQEQIKSNKKPIMDFQTKLEPLEKHIQVVTKNENILKQKCRQLEHSQEQNDYKMERLNKSETFREDELVRVNKRLDKLKGKQDKSIYYISTVIKTTVTKQKDLRTKQDRFDNNKDALCRHRDRLLKVSNELREKIDAAKRDVIASKSRRKRLRISLKKYIEEENNNLEKSKMLESTMTVLNFLFAKKYSPETLQQIRKQGRLKTEKKEIDIMGKICSHVSGVVADDWKDLYFNLPFYPDRSEEQRSKDIRIIDLISEKNDFTVDIEAKMALDKWRLFYHRATPEHLIDGLKKSRLYNICKEVEDMHSESTHRYDDN